MRASLSFLSVLLLSSSALASPIFDNSTDGSDMVLKSRDLEERGSNIITQCKKSGTFALTFDDGPYLYGGKYADLVKSYGGHASFFVNGNNWACIYDNADELIRRYKAGHMIGAHTWGHDDITTLTAAQLNQQITLVEIALKKILGIKPAFFRPPYGSYDAASLAILASRGYKSVTWSWDSGDSAGLSTAAQVKRYAALYKKYPAPVMSLNHETYATTSKTIPQVVPKLVAAGYKLVTVAECLGVSPYQSVSTPGKRDKTWTCQGTPGPGAPQ